jgi:hypothetical protein
VVRLRRGAGRVAMLAALGMIVQEKYQPFFSMPGMEKMVRRVCVIASLSTLNRAATF